MQELSFVQIRESDLALLYEARKEDGIPAGDQRSGIRLRTAEIDGIETAHNSRQGAPGGETARYRARRG